MSVTESEQINFDDDDIMEIAAYGTQAARIKKEEEELAVFIKEEISIEESFNSATTPNGMGSAIDRLTSIPIVYTTRLDQMKTWKQIKKNTSTETTEMILVESKPKNKPIPDRIKPVPSNDICISYIKLCSQVQQLNNIVKTETYLRNEKLMKMCKPLKIVLVDLESTQLTPPKILLDSIDIEDDSSNDMAPALYSSDEDEPLLKTSGNKTITFKVKDVPPSITVAIKDKKSQEADIYIIGRSGLKSYYRADMDECKKLQELHQSKKLMVIEYCCWVNRENRLRQFINIGRNMASVSNFLRKPHGCLPRPCSCCCIFGTPVQKVPSNDEFMKRLRERNDTEVQNIPESTCNIISKANNYIAKMHGDTSEVVDEPTNYLKCAVICIKYHRIIFTQTNILGENYEIGNKGDITDYVRPTVNRSIAEERQLYQTNEANKNMIYFSYLICCWHQREDVLTQLRDSSKMSPIAIRFMRTPHLCRSDKCKCCCKPVPLINVTLDDTATHNNPRVYSNKKKSKTLVPGDKDMKKKVTYTNNYIYKTPIQRHKKENKIGGRRINISAKSNNTSKRQSTIQENIDSTIDLCFNPNPIPTNSAPTNTQSQPNVSHIIDLCNEDAIFADPTKPPPPIVTNILDKFKNMKLSVNENGKLAAIINTTPGKLTTVEIKVLSDILLHAATQIKQLGIPAQEFCNRVNASTAAGGSVSSPMTPICLNAINKTANSKPGCKTHQLKSAVPTTSNKTPVSILYQMMSTESGKKNQLLVEAYKLHFKENVDKDTSDKVKPKSATYNTIPIAPKPAKSTANKEPIKVKTCSCTLVAKRKNPQIVNPAPINLLGSGLVNTVIKNILDKVNTPVVEAGHNWIPFLASNSITPALNTSVTPANHMTSLFVNNNDPIQNTSGVAQPMFTANSKVIPVENDNDPLMPTTEAEIQTPLVLNNSNFIPVQNISGTGIQPIIVALNNQIPIYVPNSNLMPMQNTLCTNDPLKIKMETNNPEPFFVANSNFVPVQNISDTDIPQFEGADHNQIPIIVPNNVFVPMQNNDVTQVQNQVNADFLNTKMLSDNNKILHFVTNSNVTQKPKTKGATVLCVPEMWADNQRTFVPLSNVTPTHNVSDEAVSSVGMPTNAEPTISDNPLLYEMLSKAAATPTNSESIPYGSLLLPHTQSRVQPLIEERNSTLRNKRKSTGKNKLPANKKLHVAMDTCNEIDIETSLTTNVIERVMAETFSQEDKMNAVNNKLFFNDDDEEDGIFGV